MLGNFRVPSTTVPSDDRLLHATLMLLSVVYLLWLEGVSKDWFLSYMDPYPFTASLATTIAVVGGFISLLAVRTPMRWRDLLLWATLTLTIIDLLGIAPKEIGIFPAVPVLSFALGTASLFSATEQAHDGNRKFYAAATASGGMSLCVWAAQSKKLLWAFSLSLVVATVSGLAVWLAKGGGASLFQPRGRSALMRSCAFLIVGGFAILLGVTFGPSLFLGISDAAMLGLGLGWGDRARLSRSGLTLAQGWSLQAFGRTLATEHGLLTCLVVGLLVWIAVVTGVVKLLYTKPDTDSEAQAARIALCAGSISSMYGLLLSIRLRPPFMTSDSVMGTATLAVVVASAGIGSSMVGASHGPGFFGKMAVALRHKVSLALLTGCLAEIALLSCLGFIYYRRNLDKMIEPYLGSGTPPGFLSGYALIPEISTAMQEAIVACEDRGFYEHDGLEWRSLHSALRLNLREARVIAGGSTITQQLAKNLFLTKERTLSRKLKEAALTFELERLLPKQRILELYLNSIEYGMNQRGVGAAARYYFGKTPSELSLPESALLAGLVSRPPHSLSLYELAVSERTALNLIKIRWIDRYWEADFERAAAIPLNRLLRLPSDATRATENGLDQQTQASSLSPILPPWYWRNIGVLIGLSIFLACVVTAGFGVKTLRSSNRGAAGAVPQSVNIKVLLSAAVCSLFAGSVLHCYQVNRERASTTIIYPYRHSPNYDFRPSDSRITCVVLHASGLGTLGTTINFFQDPNSMVSTHFIVGKDGRVFQTVPVERRAWHAGISQLDGMSDVNNFSVGIELVNRNDGTDPYSDLQYEAVALIIHQLRQSHEIPDGRIVSHAEIALPAGRKSDPEGFDFDKLRELLNPFPGTQSALARESP